MDVSSFFFLTMWLHRVRESFTEIKFNSMGWKWAKVSERIKVYNSISHMFSVTELFPVFERRMMVC